MAKIFKKSSIFCCWRKKFTVDFDGDECEVPIMPNGDFVFVSIVSNDGKNQMTTTQLSIRLEPTNKAGIFTINSLAEIYKEFKAKRREENWKNRKF